MSHSHNHSHSHSATSRKRLIAALTVTLSILVAELIGAALSNSLALLADAGHMAVDSIGLLTATIAAILMTIPREGHKTWGYARAEVIAAALQAGMLLILTAFIATKAISNLMYPSQLHSRPMMLFGAIGLLANLISLAILAGGRKDNLNMRAAFLEVATDALGSVAVIVAAGLAMVTGWDSWDAIASLIIVAMMAPRAFILLRNALRILMETAPEELDLDEVRKHIMEVDHVEDVHDLHVTTIGTGIVALTAHVTVEDSCFYDGHSIGILHEIQDCVASHFPISISHSTIQIDTAAHRDNELLQHD